ncbi:LVIVD repeat-containing protein [Archaeoglobus neptunius]|uniref:hypothetical protein n=1 Tax=Archaeoglobus neptunius TaxID=2798580 RepID=UPI0019266596|nr:hypothetical protein [Archaeoglobus neptunius]
MKRVLMLIIAIAATLNCTASAKPIERVGDFLGMIKSFDVAEIDGRTYVFLTTGSSFRILDATEATNMKEVWRYECYKAGSLTVYGNYTYVNCAYGFIIFDVSDPSKPEIVSCSEIVLQGS